MRQGGSGPRKKILIFAPSFEPAVKAGGPARSLSNLVRELGDNYTVDVVTRDRDLGDSEPFPGLSGRPVSRGPTTIYYLDEGSPAQWRSLIGRLSRVKYDLIMVNSFWDHRLSLVPVALKWAHRLHGPLLLMPRGELEPGALALKARKKRLATPFFRGIHRLGVDVVGATSTEEAERVRSWFSRALVVMTTNNVPDAIPWGEPSTTSTALRAVFLSRISPKKGVLPLLVGLRHATGKVKLSVVGPVEDAKYWGRCREAISELPPNVDVDYTPLAQRDEIPKFFWNSDCMVLLTAGENYGHVIAEALQAGCPVVTTATTPWTDVLRAGGGEIVEDRDDPLEVAAVLDRWARKAPEELADARHEARAAFDAFSVKAGPNIIELALDSLAPERASPGPGKAGDAR